MTLTTNDAWALLPVSSVAVQVTVVEPGAKRLPLNGAQPTVGVGSTASVAVGIGYATVTPAGSLVTTDPFDGIPDSAGAVVSTTVTWNEPPAERPPRSVTEQETVEVPMDRTQPATGVHVGIGSGSSS